MPAGPRRLERLVSRAALVAVAAWVAYAGGLYSYDDAFITYRMAANLAAGHGFVYNPGEWQLGSTAALYGLILGCARLAVRAGPHSGAVRGAISCASMLATGLMLPALGAGAEDAAGGRRAGLAAGLLYVASPLLFVTFGGEMPFLLALVAGAFLAERRGRPLLAAVLAALAAVTRPDGVLVDRRRAGDHRRPPAPAAVARRAIVGRTLQVDGVPVTIVGVGPAGHRAHDRHRPRHRLLDAGFGRCSPSASPRRGAGTQAARGGASP